MKKLYYLLFITFGQIHAYYPSLAEIETELETKNYNSHAPSYNSNNYNLQQNNYVFNLSNQDIIINFYVDSPVFGQQIIDAMIIPQPEKKAGQSNLMSVILPNTAPIDMHFDSCNIIIIYALLPHTEIINKAISPCYIQVTPDLKTLNDFKIVIENDQVIVTRMNTIKAIQISKNSAHDLMQWPITNQSNDIDTLKTKIIAIKEEITTIYSQEIPNLKKEIESLQNKLKKIDKDIKNLNKQWLSGSELISKKNEKKLLENKIKAQELLIKYRNEHLAYYNQKLIQFENQIQKLQTHTEKKKMNHLNQEKENKVLEYEQKPETIFNLLETNPYLKK